MKFLRRRTRRVAAELHRVQIGCINLVPILVVQSENPELWVVN